MLKGGMSGGEATPATRRGLIVIEGPIGVGKTSLARRLSDSMEGALLLERPEENPFLERFYQSPRRYALPAQLYFLFQRSRQLQDLRQGDMFSPTRIADFLLAKDSLFAGLTLDDDELYLYQQVYAQLSPKTPVPDLVVYLQAPVDTLLKRIRRRGVPYELSIEPEYLERLVEAYTRFFHTYNESPLLIVNAADINVVEHDADFETLLEYIYGIHSGRHFFNPLASKL